MQCESPRMMQLTRIEIECTSICYTEDEQDAWV